MHWIIGDDPRRTLWRDAGDSWSASEDDVTVASDVGA